MIQPYYKDDYATIYHGDCREILPQVFPETSVSLITDPVWPNAKVPLYGATDPRQMLSDMFSSLPRAAERASIHLGCDSDPRFLMTVPSNYDFFRVVSLEIARVGYKGRLLMTGDIAYLFGRVPKSKSGQHVIPGRFIDADSSGKQSNHPCPRKVGHVRWLVKWWSEDSDCIVDPFGGSCTTSLAAKMEGRKSICIEYDEAYCEEGATRLSIGPLFDFERRPVWAAM